MPFYEYQCNLCQEEQLLFHLMSEKLENDDCPVCENGKLHKKISISILGDAKVNSTAKQRVEEFIEESKTDIKKEKHRLKNRKAE